MKLSVKNLGPIKQGEIDLSKRFSVFVGYNNSGKTYMAQAVWTLFRYLYTSGIFTIPLKMTTTFPQNLHELKKSGFELNEDNIKKLILFIEEHLKIETLNTFNSDNLGKDFSLQLKGVFDSLKNNTIKIRVDDDSNNKYYHLEKAGDSFVFSVRETTKSEFYKATTSIDTHLDMGESIFDKLFEIFTTVLGRNLGITEPPFFLPANRSFYPTFYKEMVYNERLQNENRDKAIKEGQDIEKIKLLSRKPYTSPAGVLINSVYQLNFKGSPMSQPKAYYEDLIEELKVIIGGRITESTKGNGLIEFSLALEDKNELEMHVASSSANQLATLYLYFKYWANASGNILIIDEPEENLHPRNQIALLNILMKFANRNNNRVIITTHSPLMTDAVNNHLHLGYLSEKYNKNLATLIQENNLDLDADAALAHKDIGIYFFDGQNIKEYEVEEYGVDFKDFRKEQEKVADNGDILRGLILTEKKNQLREQHQKTRAYV